MTAPNPNDWPDEACDRLRAALAEPLPEFIQFGRDGGNRWAICVSPDCRGFDEDGDDLGALEEKAWAHVDDWHREAS